MHKRTILILFGAPFFILLAYFYAWIAQGISPFPQEHKAFTIIEYVDRHTFSSESDLQKWLTLTHLLSQNFQKRSSNYKIKIIIAADTSPSLKAQIEQYNVSNIEIVITNKSSIAFDPFLYFSSDDNVALIAPDFICNLHSAAPSEDIFFEVLFGHALAKKQIYLFSRFDRGRFRVIPKFILFLGADFNGDLAHKLQKRWIAQHIEYYALLEQRNILLLNPNDSSYTQSRLSRADWLVKHPNDSIFELGLLSQGLGEQFWQDLIWNCNSRYIIEPLNWPEFRSYTPYQPIITTAEILTLFPHSADSIIQCAISYNDYLSANILSIPSSLHFLALAKESFNSLSNGDQKKFIAVYGDLFAPEIFD